MEGLKGFRAIVAITAAVLVVTCSVISVQAQISTPCTASQVTSFTPCINFITGSSAGGNATPTAGCCDSVKSLMSGSIDCACLIVTGNVPISLPINRALAISLPRACNLPLQCQGENFFYDFSLVPCILDLQNICIYRRKSKVREKGETFSFVFFCSTLTFADRAGFGLKPKSYRFSPKF